MEAIAAITAARRARAQSSTKVVVTDPPGSGAHPGSRVEPHRGATGRVEHPPCPLRAQLKHRQRRGWPLLSGHNEGVTGKRLLRRPVWSVLAAVLLLMGSCSAGPVAEQLSEGEIFDGSATSVPDGAIPTTAPPAVSGPGSPASPGPAGGTVDAGRPSAGTPSPNSTPQFDSRRGKGPTGSFGPVLLREDLTLELLQQAGAAPSPSALGHLRARLGDVAGRSIGTTGPVEIEGGTRSWSAAELTELADQKAIRPAGSATIRMLFVHGTLGGNRSVLGVAVRGDVLAIFVDQVRSSGGLVGNSEGVERAVMLHEAGHILGLVDLVLDTGREDPEHPGHSPNRGSVMYWAVESTAIGQVFGDNPPDTFDDADRADLARIKAG